MDVGYYYKWLVKPYLQRCYLNVGGDKRSQKVWTVAIDGVGFWYRRSSTFIDELPRSLAISC